MSAAERLSRFVDALLRDRRPRRYPAEEDEAAAMVAAAAMKASRPGADLPRPEFIAELEQKLAREMAGEAPGAPTWSRRRILQVGGAVAAALVAGVGVDRAIQRPDVTPTPSSGATLALKNGRWVAVMPVAAVEPGHAVRFSAGAVEGFVINRNGRLQALSAVCTHMGCIVRFNAAKGSLDCPCHGASFALDGSPINHDYLQSLPRLASRVSGEMVEVMVNKEA
jgi:nitrite reductase/ring-hydroxylating ferredoxin subunit